MARPTKSQRRIKQATELLENATLHEIFDQRESDIISRWKSSNTVDQRESCYADMVALGELKDAIDTAATGG